MRRLTKRQRKGLRLATRRVLCLTPYRPDVDRSQLHVYPDGCTAHDECSMSDEYDYHHWHTLEARRKDDYRQYAGHRRGR